MCKKQDKRLTFRKRNWPSEPDSIGHILVWLNVQNVQFHFKMLKKLQMLLM